MVVGLTFGRACRALFWTDLWAILWGKAIGRNHFLLGICIGLSYGLLSTLLIGLPNGGMACIQHGILRRAPPAHWINPQALYALSELCCRADPLCERSVADISLFIGCSSSTSQHTTPYQLLQGCRKRQCKDHISKSTLLLSVAWE